jgi:hypothetical protein
MKYVLLALLVLPAIWVCSQDQLASFFVSLFANYVFLIFILFISWIYLNGFTRKKMFNFFGLENGDAVAAYISCVEEYEDKGRKIPSVSFHEMNCVSDFGNLFRFRLSYLYDSPPGFLSQVLFSDINYKIILGDPACKIAHEAKTHVFFGTSMYNQLVKNIEQDIVWGASAKVVGNDITIMFKNSGSFPDLNHAFIQRYTSSNGKTFFYIAGNSEEATIGATLHLKRYWESLHKKFSNKENFVVLIKVEIGNYNLSTELLSETF